MVLTSLLIFGARITDVSIGTLRVILVARGMRRLAPVLGFFEVLIWVAAITQIMRNLDNVLAYFAYAAGFATGTYLGMCFEEKLAVGFCMLRVIVSGNANNLIESLKQSGFGITILDGHGSRGPVKIIYTIINRKNLGKAMAIIQNCTPSAFYAVEDVRMASKGVFPPLQSGLSVFSSLRFWRKGK
jgi:uncharacterized protein YebE (UPF0316 family)